MFVESREHYQSTVGAHRPAGPYLGSSRPYLRFPPLRFWTHLGHANQMEPDASTSGGGGGGEVGKRDTLVELQRGEGASVATVPVAHRKPSYCAKREAAEYKSRTKPKKGPQIFAAVSVSTGCLSYGICMAYTSSAIPSIMEAHSPLNISTSQASWMSE